jgi:murein DD-endopeptidase MepM/ murein hydrolase activator NlpD
LAESNYRINVFDDMRAVPGGSAKSPAEWTLTDSLENIPAYHMYRSWVTNRVHPARMSEGKKLRETAIIPLRWDSCQFVAPYVGHKTSDFGFRRYRYHYGVDIKLETGDPVVSAFEGVVRVAHYDGDYGKVVVVRHSNGLETLYAHLSKISVKPGDWLDAGEVLGLGGNTGRSTGSHLHFEVRYMGDPINPNAIIDWETGKLKTDTLALTPAHFEHLRETNVAKYHAVRKGETLAAIARKYGVTVTALCKLNGIRPTTTLRIGQKLRYS